MLREKLQEWHLNPITGLQKEVVRERIEDLKADLLNPNEREYDVFLRGMARAFQEILDWEPDIPEEETKE